jgi:hypothetical protein
MPENLHHSEEAQEILGRIPGWIIRWGITLIFVIFAGIVIGCWFIKMPQTVIGSIVITTANPPTDLMVRATGRIDSIYVEDGGWVERDAVVALLYNTADYASVCHIRDSLEAYSDERLPEMVEAKWMDGRHSLGELQSLFAEFRRQCVSYRYYRETDNIGRKQELIRAQIAKQREYYDKQLIQRNTLQRNVDYQRVSLRRDSALLEQKVLSEADYEISMRSLLQQHASLESFDAGLVSTELNILQQEQQLIELETQKEEQTAEYERQLSNLRQQLLAQIAEWEYQYLIVSPVAGKVTYTQYWNTNQTVQAGGRIATVVPAESTEVIGRVDVPTASFGKVAIGQTVNVKLNGFPYMEFGMLKGRVRTLSEVPGQAGYVAEVVFPEGLHTTYKKELPLIQQMDGTAEIITRDQRLIQRFLQPIRALFDR